MLHTCILITDFYLNNFQCYFLLPNVVNWRLKILYQHVINRLLQPTNTQCVHTCMHMCMRSRLKRAFVLSHLHLINFVTLGWLFHTFITCLITVYVHAYVNNNRVIFNSVEWEVIDSSRVSIVILNANKKMNRDDKLILCVGLCVLDVIHVCREYPEEDSDQRLILYLFFSLPENTFTLLNLFSLTFIGW